MGFLFDTVANLYLLTRNLIARLRKPPGYVWMEISGDLREFEQPSGLLRRRLTPGTAAPTLEELRGRLETLSFDGRVSGVVLRIRGLNTGWSQLEELRNELARYRERGGRVIAYLLEADSRAYYLACAADEILASPLTAINAVGVRLRVNFLKEALSRAGIQAEVVAVSPYKSAGDPLVRTDFSAEAREQAERLLDGRFQELLSAISSGRKIGEEAARRLVDGAPYSAREAFAAGLLEGVCYEDEIAGRLGDGELVGVAEWTQARRTLKLPYRRRYPGRVGLVSITGTITRGRSRRLPVPLPLVGGDQAGSESIAAALRSAEKNRRVKAVLLHVDSGGGDALASDLIWREVERIRRKKPVVALMGDAAASGGYYVSASANCIFARRNTITGSIGVLFVRPILSELYAKIGVNPISIERGAHSGLYDLARHPTSEDVAVFEHQLLAFYEEFKDRVARGRLIESGKLEEIAGGRVWRGTEALERGLVDDVGGFRDAFARALDLASLPEQPPAALLKIHPPRGARPEPGKLDSAYELVDGILGDIYEQLDARCWAIMPYELRDEP